MKGLTATIDITGMDIFIEILAIVHEIMDDPDVSEKHKEKVRQWVQGHQTEYALDKPIDILATHAICPLCRR